MLEELFFLVSFRNDKYKYTTYDNAYELVK